MLLRAHIILQTVFLVHLTLTSGAHLRRGGAPDISRRRAADGAVSDRPADPDSLRHLSTHVDGQQPTVNLTKRSSRAGRYKLSTRAGGSIDNEDLRELLLPPDEEEDLWSSDDDYESRCEGRIGGSPSIIESEDSRHSLAASAIDFFHGILSDEQFGAYELEKEVEVKVSERDIRSDWVYVYYEGDVDNPDEPRYIPENWRMDETYEEAGYTFHRSVPYFLTDLLRDGTAERGSVTITLGATFSPNRPADVDSSRGELSTHVPAQQQPTVKVTKRSEWGYKCRPDGRRAQLADSLLSPPDEVDVEPENADSDNADSDNAESDNAELDNADSDNADGDDAESDDEFWSEDDGHISKYESTTQGSVSEIVDEGSRADFANKAFDFFVNIEDEKPPFDGEWSNRWDYELFTGDEVRNYLYLYYEVDYSDKDPARKDSPPKIPKNWYMDETSKDADGNTEHKWVPEHFSEVIEEGVSRGSVTIKIASNTWHAGFFTYNQQ
ncbi:MAG: hypothetical protein M1837_005950 [Sclerophora amabilis]|nr:MAG: hypothetical protein M1837_005950 [Sclerophora amabilis]